VSARPQAPPSAAAIMAGTTGYSSVKGSSKRRSHQAPDVSATRPDPNDNSSNGGGTGLGFAGAPRYGDAPRVPASANPQLPRGSM
jgi:hypothetical protein